MRYPIYVPSKGRYENCLTAKFLIKDNTPFYLVVEDHEYDQYAARFGEERLLVLPFANQGTVVPARNWIKQHSIESGYDRHWQIDDNIRYIKRKYQGKRILCNADVALSSVEDFTERYTNIAIAGLNYEMFLPNGQKTPPFRLNVHVYSCSMIDNHADIAWRGIYNEDTDLCLQALAKGYCTVLVNVFLVHKLQTMKAKGGNTPMYQGDGRLKMAQELQQRWPEYVEIKRRYGRWQHVIKNSWRQFKTPLKLKKGIDLKSLPETNEYGMSLNQVKAIKSDTVRRLYNEYTQPHELGTTS